MNTILASPVVQSGSPRKRVVILGCGFGGLQAAREFGRRFVTHWADVVVIDRRDYHLFTPLLYEAASGAISSRRLQYPLAPELRRHGVRFEQAAVTGVSLPDRRVIVESGEIAYDYLIVSGGSKTNFFGHPEFAPLTHTLKTAADADRLHSHIAGCIQIALSVDRASERARLLTFAIVGAGPTGVEIAGALQQALRARLLPPPWRDKASFKVLLIEARATILEGMPSPLSQAAESQLSHEGVVVLTGAAVEKVTPSGLVIHGQRLIPAATVIWSAGIRPALVPGLDTLPLAADGRLQVDASLRLPGHPEALAVGDMAAAGWNAGLTPANAPAAIQMGKAAARNVTRALLGLPPIPFRYSYEGDLIALGRHNAAAFVSGRVFTGYHAWMIRRLVYLGALMGNSNRLGLAVDWLRDERLSRPRRRT